MPQHTTTTRPQHLTKTETERQRQKTETERRGERREKREERREKIHFQCGGAWPLFVDVVIFWLIPFAPYSLACFSVSSAIHFRFQCIMAGQQFFTFSELFILCSYSFQFYLFFLVMQLQFSKFSEFFSYAATVFFSGINSA